MKRLLLISLLFCVGCTLDSEMKSWIGMPVDELLSEWGSPDSYIKLKDGTQVLTWSHYWDGGKCRKTFTITGGLVEKYSHSNCPPLALR